MTVSMAKTVASPDSVADEQPHSSAMHMMITQSFFIIHLQSEILLDSIPKQAKNSNKKSQKFLDFWFLP